MKQTSKNETDMLSLINKMQEQLMALNRKVDTLISRSTSEIKTPVKPMVNTSSSPAQPHHQNKSRPVYTAVCADCQKECTIPFKPTGDRPVYCQDCFSRRKVIRLSGMKVEETPKTVPVPAAVSKAVETEKPQAKKKKKAAAVKKPVAKKKTAPKKK